MDSVSGSILPGYTNIGAQLYNNPILVAGKKASALRFDSSQQQYAILDDHPNRCVGNLDLCTQGMTIAFWMYVRPKMSNWSKIFDSGGKDPNKYGISIYKGWDSDFRALFKLSNGEMLYMYQTDLAINTWIHFTIVWHPNYLKFYMDGCFEKNGRKLSNLTATTSTYPMYIGGTSSHANVDLDEVYIYEEVKTPTFIKLLQSGIGLHNP